MRSRRGTPASCPTWSRSTTSAATCTATPPSPTAGTASRRWRRRRAGAGYAYLAITDHSASHGFGNHVTDKQLAKRIEEIRAWNESAPRGFRLLAGSEVNIGVGRFTRLPRRAARRARLGDGKRPHLIRDLRAGDDRAGDRGDGEPAGRLHRPPHGQAAAAARALRRGHAADRRGRGEDRHDDGDQRQSESPRPQRAQCQARRRGRGRGSSAPRTRTAPRRWRTSATRWRPRRRAWLSADQIANTRTWRSFAPLRKRAKKRLRRYRTGFGSFDAAGRPQTVEDDLDQPRPAAGAGTVAPG